MTAAELIQKLKKFPPSMPVLVSDIEDFSTPNLTVVPVYCLQNRYYDDDPNYNADYLPGGEVIDAIILN
jgi:hypothetical protein